MRVTIVGGGLQGVELCWLARKAGWETLLVDERPSPPALWLADVFAQCDEAGRFRRLDTESGTPDFGD